MTPRKAIRDVPASVRQRLRNFARRQGADFESVLQRFAVERFLYRLSASDEVNRFTLKGAALLRMWAGQELRPTRDIDFLARGARDEAAIRTALRDVCGVPCQEDGVVFDPATIAITSIRIEQPNGGLRVRIRGGLGQVRLSVPIDIGFGDVLTLGRREEDYPTLLDLPAPRLWTYPRETMVAEKFHAMATRSTPPFSILPFFLVFLLLLMQLFCTRDAGQLRQIQPLQTLHTASFATVFNRSIDHFTRDD